MAHTIRDMSGVITLAIDGSDETSRLVAVSTSHSIFQDCGTAIIHLNADLAASENELPIALYANSELIFNGTTRRSTYPYYKDTFAFACTDVMQNTTRPWGGAGTDPELDALLNRVYTNQTADAVKVNLMECMAVDVSLHVVDAPSTWTLGTIEPVVLRVGQTSLQLIRSLDELEGTWTATRGNGAIYNQRLVNTPASVTYTEGVDIIDADLELYGADTIINKCIIYGLQIAILYVGGPGVGEYAIVNSDVPDPPKYQTRVFRTNFVEDNTTAVDFAQRYVENHNFFHENGTLTIVGDEARVVGETIHITSDRLYFDDDRFVAGVQHEYNKSNGWITKLNWIRV